MVSFVHYISHETIRYNKLDRICLVKLPDISNCSWLIFWTSSGCLAISQNTISWMNEWMNECVLIWLTSSEWNKWKDKLLITLKSNYECSKGIIWSKLIKSRINYILVSLVQYVFHWYLFWCSENKHCSFILVFLHLKSSNVSCHENGRLKLLILIVIYFSGPNYIPLVTWVASWYEAFF